MKMRLVLQQRLRFIDYRTSGTNKQRPVKMKNHTGAQHSVPQKSRPLRNLWPLREPVFTAVYLRGKLYLQAETYSSCIHWKEEITILESLKPRAPRMNQPACDYKSRCRSRSSKKRCSLTSCPRFKAFLQLLHNAALTYCIYHTNL